jgi:secreted PhoX family phosphatase
MNRHKIGLASIVTLAAILLLIPLNSMAQDPSADLLISLDDPMAPFLESRAVAVKEGATGEFRKMEWVAIDPANNKLYITMSEIGKTMSDGEGDIKLEENKCGIVYEADLDKNFDIKSLKPAIVGGPYNEDAKDGNKCAVDNVSNPDSLYVDPQGMVWIGEDTGNHVNNMIWKWDPKTKKLARFATLPKKSEATGVMITPNNDLFFSVQHPSGMSMYPYNRSAVVVVNGFKATDSFSDVAVPKGNDMNTVKLAKGEAQILARVGEEIPHDMQGQRWGQVNTVNGDFLLMCNQPDGNIFLPTNDKGTEGYLYTNYECRPGAVGKMYIQQTGKAWEVLEGENVNFASVKGTWNLCGTSHTPWGTGLTSEEYEPFATKSDWKANLGKSMNEYLGGEQANPYDYGWLIELYPDPKGNVIETKLVKQYALGRFSHENAMTMPDEKTIYHGDDGTGVVLFKSVLDEAGDMSSATLYAAKVTQKGDNLDLKWIELGKGNNDDIYDAIRAVKLPK